MATKKGKKMNSKPKKEALTLMNLKVTGEERRTLETNAKKYAKGNLSAWLRIAGARFKPAKNQIIF